MFLHLTKVECSRFFFLHMVHMFVSMCIHFVLDLKQNTSGMAMGWVKWVTHPDRPLLVVVY